MVHKAKEAADIQKQLTTHTLGYSFATHQLEDGVDIRKIQLMLGHRSLRATIKMRGAKTTLGSRRYLSEPSRLPGKDQRREGSSCRWSTFMWCSRFPTC